MKKYLFFVGLLAFQGISSAQSASGLDQRIKKIAYNVDQVFTVNIVRGVGTHILLNDDERIVKAAPGFGADCKDVNHDWCIVANVGENSIFVKAKSGAEDANNLEVVTTKRLYTFDFVIPKKPNREKDSVFRISFKYPDEKKSPVLSADQIMAALQIEQEIKKEEINKKMAVSNKPVNWNYSKENIGDSEAISPSMTYDDGRFTYLRFDGNRAMPEVFAIDSQGNESTVTTHIEGDANDTLVIHKVWKHFVLRAGRQVVGIWNENYDLEGVTSPNGVTVQGVKRHVKESRE